MTRRELLGMLAAAVVDPERLIWQPGKKLISIPSPFTSVESPLLLSLYEVNEIYLRPALLAIADRTDQWLLTIMRR